MAALFPESVTISDDFLTCRFCQKTLNKPKLLPCQHTFCKDCLIKNITPSEYTVTCPCCERIVKVENGDIEQLPDNYLFPIILEQRAAPIEYCLPCQFDNKKTKATHKCLDCQDTFCNECKKFHKFSSHTQNHKVVDITDIKKGKYENEMKSKKMKKCQKHSTKERVLPLDLYCEDCQCLVCKHGITMEHKSHSCIMLEAFEEKERMTLKGTTQQIDDIQEKESRFSDHLDNTSQSLKTEREAVEDQVHKAADELYALVDKVKEDKLQEIKNHYKEELEKVEVVKQKQQQLRNNTNTMKSFADAFLHHTSKVDFLSHFKDVEYRVKDFLERKEDIFITSKHIHIENSPCDKAVKIVKNILGKISIQKKTSTESGKMKKVLKEIGKPQVLFDIELAMNAISGLTVTKENDIIAVGGSQIGVFCNDGRHKKWIHCKKLTMAGDVLVKGDSVYIADKAMQKKKILVIDMNGMLQREIIMPDSEQLFSYFKNGLNLAVDDNENIYISSLRTQIVYKCTPQSTTPQTFLTDATKPGLQVPQYLCITPKQELVVSNKDNIQAYNWNGELVWQYDGRDVGDGSMALYNSKGVCCDQEGNVYVADNGNHRILVVNGGTFIGSIKPKALELPCALTLNSNHELIISSSTNNIMKVKFWK